MRVWFTMIIGTALLGLSALPAPVLAQQKTVRACQEEWRANKAENQAKGITEKAYVAQCRAGGSAAQPVPAAPAARTAPIPSAAAPAPQKTVRVCRDEWRANREGYQAAKVTEKAYVEKCRAGETIALPAPTASPSSAPNAAAPSSRPTTPPSSAPSATAPSPAPTSPSAPPATATPTGAGEFQSEAQAKAHCPGDTVVWANLSSKIYHFAGYRSYGNTKRGAYMCEREATMQGFRASKTEKRPSA
jgi:hypothetical protein